MSMYQDFATLYDMLTFDVDYEQMADFIQSRLKQNGHDKGLVLDLACGTGTLTLALSARGYDMLGADNSEDMLSVARQKKGAEKILFLHQPMESFELYGTVDAIVCALDSVNYLTEAEDFTSMLRLCANYLNPGGILIFDVNSEYKFSHVLGQETYTYEQDNIYYIWENDFEKETGLCQLYLTFFEKTEKGLYRRIDEEHTQRVYTHEDIKKALAQAGLSLQACYDGYRDKAPDATTQRIVYEAIKN
ncbi:MAG: class I SAM-dependent methyltransferase [Ruminococcaceae bacterium]|nr:class I SAM-dependent methyltransferase [Oscillospiraceae bacterium]